MNASREINCRWRTDVVVPVVGAAATGLQIADEIRRSGREVTLAVGEHLRMPRCYRGRDIQYWMHVSGLLDRKGNAQHDGGVGTVPGIYFMGLPFMRKRKSSFMFGTGDDARDICRHLAAYLEGTIETDTYCRWGSL